MFRSKSKSTVQAVQTVEQVFWTEYIDDEKKEKLETFRERLRNKKLLLEGTHLATNSALLRFLKARGWDLAKAELMYSNMVEWRTSFKTNEVFESLDYPEKVQVLEIYPQFYSGTDKFGRPVYIERTGQIDYAKLVGVTSVDRLIQFHVQCYESLVREKFLACSKAAGREVMTTTTILDLSGLTLTNFYKCKDALKRISQIDQDYYPEHLGAMIIINAPRIFTTIWNVIKPWLDQQTTSKMQVNS
jgi:hypothetical protein